MNVYSSKAAFDFVQKAVADNAVALLRDDVYRPLKDGVILPNGDVYDIGSRFQVKAPVEAPAKVVKAPVEVAEVVEAPVEAPAEVVEAPVEPKAKEAKVEEAPKTTTRRKAAAAK